VRLRILLAHGTGCFGFHLPHVLEGIDPGFLGRVITGTAQFDVRELLREGRFFQFGFQVDGSDR
jgi:hypothetical protein